ncbi:MAG: 2Fe-2S iron-sulfur cluster binding domain-containing protein, partial [Syntrophomonadaceae bacterium]|nr:2Fe-2S iron-sulfur cluster binding domain-containing protein [Syntrophomonadaceae bacterium]
MPDILFMPENIKVNILPGDTVLEAARRVNLIIESPCDGNGTCGKCKVRVSHGLENGVSLLDENDELSAEEIEQGYVLACQAAVTGDVTVETVSTAGQNKTLKILSEGQSFAYDIINFITKKYENGATTVYAGGIPIGTEEGDTSGMNYGLAIDIGTTTLVCAMIDVLTGRELTSVSALNPQSLHAQDVLTRIKFASKAEGLKIMYEGMGAELRNMVADVCQEVGIESKYIYEAVYSGNTTMLHLAAN